MKGKRNHTVLYQPICKRCHFIVKASVDVALAKMLMNNHLVKSHGFRFDFSHNYPLNDYKESFKIMRTLDPPASEVRAIFMAQEKPAFYKVACRPKIPSVSV